MTSTYTFSSSSDFGNNLRTYQLHKEIIAESFTPSILRINTEGDVVDIIFDSALSGGEQTTLNTLVSNHSPVTSVFDNISTSSSTVETTAKTYVDMPNMSFTTTSVGTHDYLVTFDATVETSNNKKKMYFVLNVDGSDVSETEKKIKSSSKNIQQQVIIRYKLQDIAHATVIKVMWKVQSGSLIANERVLHVQKI